MYDRFVVLGLVWATVLFVVVLNWGALFIVSKIAPETKVPQQQEECPR